jgi:hypothetical protein
MAAGTVGQKSCESKLLSIFILARDDNYMHDFRYRITTTINYLARNLKRLERLNDVEILVVDWGSETPLAKTLPLLPEAEQIARFVYVPIEVIREVQTREEDFNVSLAWNVAVRRTRCEFTLVFAADSLMTAYGLDTLLRLLEGRLHIPAAVDQTYFLCCRYQVPWRFVESRPDLDEWDRFLLLNTHDLLGESAALLGVSKGAGSLLMHRSLMEELHGADESLEQYGWGDMEFGLRITRRYPWMELSAFGIVQYHMEHAPFGKRVSVVRQETNPWIINPEFVVNDEKWGLADYEFEIQTSQIACALEEAKDPLENHSHQDVLAELNSREVQIQVKQTIERFLLEGEGWKIEKGDLDAIFFLAWYCLFYQPYRYLEFGIARGFTAGTVATICKASEIYGIDQWEGPAYQFSPMAVARALRRECCHCGYVRFVNGEIKTAVHRLKKTFIGSFSMDLVLIQGEMLGEKATEQIVELMSHLSAGGGLVLNCKSSDRFTSIWTQIRIQFPEFAYFQSAGQNTGFILKASLEKGKEISEVTKIGFNKKFWWGSLLKCQGIKLGRNLRRLVQYPKEVICRILGRR